MSDERDMLAAEYALGTLDAAQRETAARLRREDAAFDRAVTDWEARLAPLAQRVPPLAPSPGLWPRIATALGQEASETATQGMTASDTTERDNVVYLRRSVRRWRIATSATGALAAALALFVVDRTLLHAPASQPAAYFAAVNRGGDMPALIVRVDLASHSVMVRPVETETPPDRSLQLWYVAAGKAPMSMGLVRKDREHMPMPSHMEMKNGMFAVSVEPMGGSPTGAPTGPIVYKGMLVAE